MRVRAVSRYTAQYADPIRVAAGATVTVERRDDQWPRWCWCRAADGREGWVPDEMLSSTAPGPATLREAYDACELTLAVGDAVDVRREFGGWFLGTNADGGTGWFPRERVEVLPG